MKRHNSSGFTLMEMLIVVAIIAILVAIAIPTFTNALEKSREAADEANIRTAYAQVMADGMLENENTSAPEDTQYITYKYDKANGTYTATVKATQQTSGWVSGTVVVGGSTIPAAKDGESWTVQYTKASGTVTISKAS